MAQKIHEQADVIVLGGGAAGLMCAAEAGRRGRRVLVVEHGPAPGRKLLVSGGGRCNFTNLGASAENYLSENPDFCRSSLARFGPADFVALLERHGVPWAEEERGQLFCAGSSRRILNMLVRECSDAGVRILLDCRVHHVDEAFRVGTSRGELRSRSLVVATGGLSYPNLGATDLGFRLARQFGLTVVPPRPALVPLTFDRHSLHWGELAGLSVDAVVECNGRRFRGSVLFTHRGLSGPAALQASSYWRAGDPISLALSPETDFGRVFGERRAQRVELRSALARHLPKRLADKWCEHRALTRPMNQYSAKELDRIATELQRWTLVPAGTEGYAKAEVTAGGVDTRELSSKTMESRRRPGLYFVGEVADVTGRLGGFNLQWAWSSGFAAGRHA